MEIHQPFRNGYSSEEQKSMERACSIQVPHSRVTIAAQLIGILRYDSFLIPVTLLNDIYCCFPSMLQWYFSVTVFLWHFVVLFSLRVRRPLLLPLAILSCVTCCEELSPNLQYGHSNKQTSNMFSDQEGYDTLLYCIFYCCLKFRMVLISYTISFYVDELKLMLSMKAWPS